MDVKFKRFLGQDRVDSVTLRTADDFLFAGMTFSYAATAARGRGDVKEAQKQEQVAGTLLGAGAQLAESPEAQATDVELRGSGARKFYAAMVAGTEAMCETVRCGTMPDAVDPAALLAAHVNVVE